MASGLGLNEDTAEPAARPGAPRRGWALAVVLGYGLQVAWRLWLARDVSAPIAHFDEDDYLLVARYLSGGPAANLSYRSPLRPMGYPLLLAPLYWFTHDTGVVFRGAQCVNALLSAASFPLGVQIAQRWLAASRSWAWACAFAVALLPAAVYYSSFILTESLFIPLFLGWLVLVQAWLSAPGPSSRTVVAAAAGLVAGYAAVSHVRGLVIGALHAALCLGIAAFAARIGQRHLRRGAVVSVVCLVAVGAVGAVVDRRLEAALYPDGTWHAPVLGRLSSPAGWVRIVADGAGQLWYLSVATWVLVALGIAFAVRLLRRRGMPASVRAALALGLFVTVLIALATAAGIPGDENRVNNHVQGRYVLFTASLWALVALAALGRATIRAALAGLLAAVVGTGLLAAVVFLHAGRRMPHELWITFDNPELALLARRGWTGFTPDDLLRVSVIASAAGALLVAAILVLRRAGGPSLPALVLCTLLPVHVWAMSVITRNIGEAWVRQYETGAPSLVRGAALQPHLDVVAASRDVNAFVLVRLQRQVWWGRVEQFDAHSPGAGPPADASIVVVPPGVDAGTWDTAGSVFDRVLVVHDPIGAEWVVWRRSPP